MKLVLNDKRDKTVGSTRIWIYNLYQWLEELGYNVTLNDWEHYQDYDCAIFGKAEPVEEFKKAKQQNQDLVCGKVQSNIHNQDYLKYADFFIVGSIEERDRFYRYSQNAFIIPLVETYFDKVKEHEDHKPIVLGYHGNSVHLTQFTPNIKPALEQLSEEYPIKLVAIYDKTVGLWNRGRPNIDIEDIQWDINTLQQQLLRCDIGLVPGLVPIYNKEKRVIFDMLNLTRPDDSGYNHDYLLRFKINTNSGRAFVFHQLGIPVVSDFLPSNFHILADPCNGYLAHSTEGWLYALRKLCQSAQKRQQIADSALKAFNRYYNPLDWVERLCEKIKFFIA